eukprot:2720910-Heterocapsa_arctica.AAC.1
MFAFLCHDPKTNLEVWVYPIKHFHGSAVFALPLTLMSVPGSDCKFFEFVMEEAPYFISIVQLDDKAMAAQVLPRSWAWQWQHLPVAFRAQQPRLRLFLD